MENKKRGLIVAIAEGSRIIGDGEKILWDILDDRLFFKNTTIGNVVISGRKSYETLPDKYRPLSKRTNIVVTRDPTWRTKTPKEDKVIIAMSLWEAMERAERSEGEKIFNIGGGEIYRLGLNSIVYDEIHITTVKGVFAGATTFPLLPFSLEANYQLVDTIEIKKEEGRNSHDAVIRSYKRNSALFA